MGRNYELVVIQRDVATPQRVAQELATLGSTCTIVKPATSHRRDPRSSDLSTAVARNEATVHSHADWIVFLDANLVLESNWLGQLRLDLEYAEVVDSPVSVGDDPWPIDAGVRGDIAYRRRFLEKASGFPVEVRTAGQEDLLLGMRCLVDQRPIARGRRRSHVAYGDGRRPA
jgi:hypothetical protein